MFKTLRDFVRRHLTDLGQLRDHPHAIAGGIAIGTLIGFTPLISIKTILAIVLAWLFRCNRIAAAIAVTLHDITLPLSPFLARFEYGLGHWLLTHPHQWPPALQTHDFHLSTWFHWQMLHDLVWPMLIGALIVGTPLSIAAWFLSLGFIRRRQRRRAAESVAALNSGEPDWPQ